ncbi:MAG TPA: class I SAM-dependent methyltransferase [Acidimicrobiales bacterium]|nr:class I SAM-dependent methyltransferase [Acidimicrobiales bacterium]
MEVIDPGQNELALAAYYDQEGDERLTRPIDPRREAARGEFLAALPARGRNSVLEIGSGPGRDAVAFLSAGHRYVAVDISAGHARLCRATGAAVALASARRLPFVTASFDAVWTMSTLMHIPNSAIKTALAEVSRVLVPGGFAAIGVWGGPDVEEHSSQNPGRGLPARLFSRRSDDRWQSLIATIGTIEAFETWGDDDFFYQYSVVRRHLA